MKDYQRILDTLISRCQTQPQSGSRGDEFENQTIREVVEAGMKAVSPLEFIEWIREHKLYSFYLYEAQQMGVCAKPRELAAFIMGMILREERAENE